jgi:hypothetical protein
MPYGITCGTRLWAVAGNRALHAPSAVSAPGVSPYTPRSAVPPPPRTHLDAVGEPAVALVPLHGADVLPEPVAVQPLRILDVLLRV